MKPASVAFTEMSVRCLCAILRVDYNHLDAQAYRQIRLPIRHGGLGLHDWAEHAEDAYTASVNGESKRDLADDPFAPAEAQTREDGMWEDIMDAIKVESKPFFDHLQRNKSKMASRWLVGDITVASSQPSNAFRAAMLFRLRWAGAHPDQPTPFKCRCKFPGDRVRGTTMRDMVMHLVGCSQNGGPTKRHHFVRDALAGLMTRAGYSVQTEVVLTPELRMDIVATPPNGATIYIDTTVPNSTSRSLQHKTIEQTDKMKDAEKRKKYEEFVKNANARYLTFVIDIYGKSPKPTKDFLSEVTAKIKTCAAESASTEHITVTIATTALSKALAFGNGTCLLNSQQLRLFGVNFGALPAPIFAPGNQPPAAPPAADPPSASASQPAPSAELDPDDDEDYYLPPGVRPASMEPDARYSSDDDEPQPVDPNAGATSANLAAPSNNPVFAPQTIPSLDQIAPSLSNAAAFAPSVRESIARLSHSLYQATQAKFISTYTSSPLLCEQASPARPSAAQASPARHAPSQQ